MNSAGREQVAGLGELIGRSRRYGGCGRVFSRNILSMRSVIRKPLTMLVIEAATATAPRIVVKVGLLFAGDQDRSDDRDGGDGVGQRHQRRVQQARDVLDDLEADERREHEHEQHRPEIESRHWGSLKTLCSVGL